MNAVKVRRILVGVDGSASSLCALRWANALAAEQDATVSAVAAWNYPAAMLMPVVGGAVIPGDAMAESAGGALAANIAGTPNTARVTQQWVVMGAPRMVLTEASEDHDVLVVGRTARRRIAQLWLGSTAAYCVRHASCPVVVVRDSVAPEHSVTVAVDGSPSSIEALVWAIELGAGHDILAVYSHDEWELDDLPLDDQFRVQLDAEADKVLEEAVTRACERADVDPSRVKRQVRQGDPRTTIIEQADPSELLVLGAQGHSGLARWVLGSLADYAVTHAPGTVAIWR